MCVIAYGQAQTIRRYVKRMMAANRHGAGIAWIEDNEVHFIKGIMSDDQARLILRRLKGADVVFHARIATAGGFGPMLTHPFPVSLTRDNALSGSVDKVLFHNGHVPNFTQWLPSQMKQGEAFDWSDSRAVAYGLSIGALSPEDLKRLPGKFLLLTKKEADIYGDWKTLDGLKFSNLNFLVDPFVRHSNMAFHPQAVVKQKDVLHFTKGQKKANRKATEPKTYKILANGTAVEAPEHKGPGTIKVYPGTYLDPETQKVYEFLNENPDFWEHPLNHGTERKF